MTHSITTAEDLSWLLTHTHGFRGGQITDIHVAKRRMFDEASGREVTVSSTVTVLIRYPVHGVLRVAKLSMEAVSDLSLFEQDGADWALVGGIQVEFSEGKLRFWFDPHGNLYVVCEEAMFEEVSLPHAEGKRETEVEQWVFQADAGDAPTVSWLLHQLDQTGMPCVWKAGVCGKRADQGVCWQGELASTVHELDGPAIPLEVEAYALIDGEGFGIRVQLREARGRQGHRLLAMLAHVITSAYAGTCLAGQSLFTPSEKAVGQSKKRKHE